MKVTAFRDIPLKKETESLSDLKPRQITKIKTQRGKKTKISITYEIPPDGNRSESLTTTITSEEEATSEFYELLDELLPILIETIGLDETTWTDAQVIGLSVKREKQGTGINITGTREINGAHPCPTSPYVIVTEDLIREIETEALKYVDGNRRQQSLFDQ
jgi:hypothetical protein